CRTDLNNDVGCRGLRELAILDDNLAQILTFDQFHNEINQLILGDAEIVDSHGIRMPEPSPDLRFTMKTLNGMRVGTVLRIEDLDCRRITNIYAPGAINSAHPTETEPGLKAISVIDSLPDKGIRKHRLRNTGRRLFVKLRSCRISGRCCPGLSLSQLEAALRAKSFAIGWGSAVCTKHNGYLPSLAALATTVPVIARQDRRKNEVRSQSYLTLIPTDN